MAIHDRSLRDVPVELQIVTFSAHNQVEVTGVLFALPVAIHGRLLRDVTFRLNPRPCLLSAHNQVEVTGVLFALQLC